MPELPEVETMRRGVQSVAGSRIVAVERPLCRKRPIRIAPRIDALRRRVLGRQIDQVGRIGKRVILHLDGPRDTIVLEPRMTGLVLLADPPTREHLRLRIALDGPVRELWFWDRRGLGSVRLLSAAQLASEYGPGKLGVDALAITAEELRQTLRHSRRAIKVALLDQKVVAGVGNLYASELLFRAGVHPAARCNRLTAAGWQRIHAAMVEVLQEAIRYEGSTLADGTYRNALNQSGGYQNHHRVYDRAGQSCNQCQRPIVRIVQAQRATFFCGVCQRRR